MFYQNDGAGQLVYNLKKNTLDLKIRKNKLKS
jgi:hypothetical protein